MYDTQLLTVCLNVNVHVYLFVFCYYQSCKKCNIAITKFAELFAECNLPRQMVLVLDCFIYRIYIFLKFNVLVEYWIKQFPPDSVNSVFYNIIFYNLKVVDPI